MSTDTPALANCPFCNCDDIGTESTATDGSVWCRGCSARITKRHHHPRLDAGQRDAITAWNARALPHPAPAEPAGEWVTDEMVEAGCRAWKDRDGSTAAEIMRAAITAALATAPQPLPADSSAGQTRDRRGFIELTPAESQSGHDRVRWAQGLIEQLPATHEGRNSWLLNYGMKSDATLSASEPLPTGEAETIERCAKVADEIGASYGEDEARWLECSETIAAHIRALLPTPPVQSLQRGETP